LLFAIGTASIRRGKKHDPDRNLGLSHPAAFFNTDADFRAQIELNERVGLKS
jgi:hypothetical protein